MHKYWGIYVDWVFQQTLQKYALFIQVFQFKEFFKVELTKKDGKAFYSDEYSIRKCHLRSMKRSFWSAEVQY